MAKRGRKPLTDEQRIAKMAERAEYRKANMRNVLLNADDIESLRVAVFAEGMTEHGWLVKTIRKALRKYRGDGAMARWEEIKRIQSEPLGIRVGADGGCERV